jgi:tape measure domain-containing protein
MAVVDPLILELRADMGRYKAELRATTSLVTTSLARQERAAQRLEAQMRRSSGAIGASLKGIAASLAGAFSVQQIGGLIDNFTRLQNSLRVAGLEGDGLANVQEKLLGLSTRYGVSINELADLYGKSSQAASDLGASEAQLLQITEASAQALKITGTSATQAQGALLGLTQALSSGIVRAEEFNQINEGGLRPLLQVAANTEKYGGSVAKLRAAVVDGKVSSQEFYQAILQGSAELDAKASKATLTLAGAFTALASQLTVYVGEASAANGVTAGLAAAIGLLADNLDTIIPALAIIGVAIGGRLVAAAVGGGTALRALAAYASIATTSLAGTALAARGAGAALLAAFGGPVGLAITALTLGIGYLAVEARGASVELDKLKSSADQAEAEADNMESRLRSAGVALENVANSGENAADGIDATSRAAAQAQKRLKDLEDQAGITALKLNQLKLIEARGARDVIAAREQRNVLANSTGRFATTPGAIAATERQSAVLGEKDREIAALVRQRDAIIAGIKAGVDVSKDSPTPSVASSTGKAKKGRAGSSGPSAAEIEQRFNSELISLTQQTLSAQQSIAKSADEKAELELRSVELAKTAAIEGIKAEKDYNETQKKRLIQQVETLAFEEQARVEQQRQAQLLQEAAELAQEQFDQAREALAFQFETARSQSDRRDIALEMVDLEYRYREAILQGVLASEATTEAEKERARLALEGLQAARARNETSARRDTQGPLDRYLDDLQKTPAQINEEIQGYGVDALKDLNRGLADAIVNGGDLGDVLEDTGKRFLAQLVAMTLQLLIIKPLLEKLGSSAGGGGTGGLLTGIANAFTSIFAKKPAGRASGGQVDAGQIYRVNEGTRPEFFRPNTGGDIIPLSKMRAAPSAQAQGGGTSTIRLELSGDIQAQMTEIAAGVSVEVVRAAEPSLTNKAVSETFRRGQRPSIGR